MSFLTVGWQDRKKRLIRELFITFKTQLMDLKVKPHSKFIDTQHSKAPSTYRGEIAQSPIHILPTWDTVWALTCINMSFGISLIVPCLIPIDKFANMDPLLSLTLALDI